MGAATRWSLPVRQLDSGFVFIDVAVDRWATERKHLLIKETQTWKTLTYGGNILARVSRLNDCVLLLGIAALAFAADAIVDVES